MHLSYCHLKSPAVASGWSLLELLMALVLMTIVATLALAAPQLYNSWQGHILYDERQRLAQQIRFARLTGVQKKAKVNLCWSKVCGSYVGFLTYLDTNQDGYETPLSQWKINQKVSFHFNRGSQISFNRAGNTAHSGTLVVCLAKASSSGLNKKSRVTL